MGRSARQLGLLLWKNWLLQKRRKVLTFFEIGLPVILTVVLLLIRLRIKSTLVENGAQWDSFPLKEGLPENLQLLPPPGVRCAPRRWKWDVLYSPEVPVVTRIINDAFTPPYLNFNSIGFESEAALVKHYTNMEQCLKDNLIIAVVFDDQLVNNQSLSSTKNITYKLRPKAEQLAGASGFSISSSSSWRTEYSFPSTNSLGPRNNATTGGSPGYYKEAFLAIQRALDFAIIRELNSSSSSMLDELEVRLKRHPYPPYVDDPVVMILQFQFPFILMLSFIVVAPSICKDIVLEKEHKLKETMKMMGLSNWLHWTAWFIKFFIFQLVAVTFMTLFLHINTPKGALINYTNPSVTFVFLMLFTTAITMFCFAISTFCSKANSGAAAGAILYLLAYVPFFFFQNNMDTLSAGNRAAASIDYQLAMSFGSVIISQYEGIGVGVQWSNLNRPFSPDNGFTMMHVMLMLLLDIVVYGIITWYFDNIFPGEFGLPKPFYFPFTKTYWCGNSANREELFEDSAINNPEFFESYSGGKPGISIQNLRKVFKGRNAKKVAVEGTTLDMYDGQISALLGHNGAGKTTTMMMLTGFLPPTSGSAYVGGYDIRRNMDSVRESLGLCPQHNVLFDLMTVEEHLTFFAKLKGSQNIKDEVNEMIVLLNLESKRDAASSSLSGGMKRKLSVGIALVGGSKVVILDEPTSGMDPEARRQTWDILQSQREGRTMLLSTHYMDEADFLGDRIAIMAEGRVVCCGSALFLKGKYGIGYHMAIVKDTHCKVSEITKMIKAFVPEAKLESNISAELSYVLPHESSTQFEELFTQIEKQKNELGIVSFGASVTTLEEVFLKVGESMDASVTNRLHGDTEEDNSNGVVLSESLGFSNPGFKDDKPPNGLPPPSVSGETIIKGHSIVLPSQPLPDYPQSRPQTGKSGSRVIDTNNDLPAVFDVAFKKNSSFFLVSQQFFGMFVKRAIHSWRNILITLTQLIVPVVFTILGCVVVSTIPGPRDPPPYSLRLYHFDNPVSPYSKIAPIDSSVTGLADNFVNLVSNPDEIPMMQSSTYPEEAIEDYLFKKGKEVIEVYNRQYMIAMTISGTTYDSNASTLLTGHFNNEAYHTPAIVLNVLNNVVLRLLTGDHYISTSNYPLPLDPNNSDNQQVIASSITGFMISYLMTFGMAFLVGTFVVFLIKERSTSARHVQFVSGVTAATFWLSTFIWDLINYLIPALLLLVVVAAFQMEEFVSGSNIWLLLMILLLYAWAVLPMVYLLSFVFSVPSSGYVWITVLNIFTGTAAVLAVVILSIPSLGTEAIGDGLRWLFYIILPNFCFGSAIQDMFTNYGNMKVCDLFTERLNNTPVADFCDLISQFNLTNPCCKDNCGAVCSSYQKDYMAWEYPGIGKSLLFMGAQGAFFLALLFIGESGWMTKCWQRAVQGTVGGRQERRLQPEMEAISMQTFSQVALTDPDVAAENQRLLNTPLDDLKRTDTLILQDLYKYYGPLLAVDGLSVGISQGECFGLLGVNGAGKTSTFKMLTGDVTLSSGNAYLNGHSVISDIQEVQQCLGYCPQFDALIDQMTVTETLRMYARLRGVEERAINKLIKAMTTSLLLNEYADKQAGQLSGGNKRKLSTAIALIGDPPVIFLDEPTSGMDPLARRLLWDTLTRVRASGRTLVLTSHSMEECEALCTRVAIMVNGKFRCLGGTQHLKSKFGEGYTLIAKIDIATIPPPSPPGSHEVVTESTQSGESSDRGNLVEFQAWVERAFPGCILKDVHQGLLQYQLPSGEEHGIGHIFGCMEHAKERFGLQDYSVSQTTLEQVFLNFARSQVEPQETSMTCGVKCGNCCRFFFCCGCCKS